MNLLLIEDDTALHTALSCSLTRLGWQVELCVDGRAALPRWRASHPDVVLLDLTLPGRDDDNESKAIYHAGQVMDLSSRELAMLRTLLARAGQAEAACAKSWWALAPI